MLNKFLTTVAIQQGQVISRGLHQLKSTAQWDHLSKHDSEPLSYT